MSRANATPSDRPRNNPVRHGLVALATAAVTVMLGVSVPAQAAQDTTTEYQYDPEGNLTHIISPLDPNPASPTVTTDLSYDSLDRNTQVKQYPVPVAGQVQQPTIGLGYNLQDQQTKVTDPRGLVTTSPRTGLGNLSNVNSPDSGLTTNNLYDGLGNLTKRTDAQGKATSYSYDALNRLTAVNYATGVDTVFTYDGGPANTDPANIGKLTKLTDESGVTSYGYDSRGRLITKTQNLSEPAPQAQTAWTLSVGYGYGASGTGAAGKLASLTYPSGNRVNYVYDSAGRLYSITLNPTNANGIGPNLSQTVNLLTNITYQPTGEFWTASWGNDSAASPNTVSRQRDGDGRLWKYNLGNNVRGGLVRYVEYDPASRVTAMTHAGTGTGAFTPANFDQHYTYDNLGRLTDYSLGTPATASQHYDYDESGNRTATGPYTHNVDTLSNRLIGTTGPAPAKANQYDLAGNLAADGIFAYTYSDRGRLSSVARASNPAAAIASYAYNGLDQRVRKTLAIETNTTQYVYDEQGHLLGEYDFYGRPLQETVYLGDLPVAVLTQALPPRLAGAVVADNSDTTSAAAGTWSTATTPVGGFQGTDHRTHAAVTGTSTDGFSWKLALPSAGKYYFQARWVADATRATDAKYTLSGANTDGTTVKTVDQTASGTPWTYLGLKTVTAATTVTVKLSPSTTGTVSADAVQAIPANATTTSVNYVYADHLGTPRVITRASDNQMVWRWDSADPFGVAQPNQDPSGFGAFKYNPRFPGQLYDAETGLNYNGHRHYEPDTGTYTQSDPIGLAGGINTYAYVGGNPVNDIDPEGLAPKAGPLGLAAVLGQKVIDKCNKLPSCKSKLDDLENKAKELCGKVQCKLHKDKEGHPFEDSNGGVQMCAHYQIDCWIEGQKGAGNRFSSHWKLPALCWKPGDQFPTIEW